ncbi:Zinc finger protein-likeinteracting with ribonucleoprotein K [Orchesella cincta]|uniref:Zinc finger protein-likeinteracting with ribonucleoprotein K n=1 Tax=Orchesella cincta TaxID=48709 RepID=A0A1D2MKA3_ORCCI|nr:Zinc finger protein-likeinteracting with ribonucleoprotein K [Orchesella cincta]
MSQSQIANLQMSLLKNLFSISLHKRSLRRLSTGKKRKRGWPGPTISNDTGDCIIMIAYSRYGHTHRHLHYGHLPPQKHSSPLSMSPGSSTRLFNLACCDLVIRKFWKGKQQHCFLLKFLWTMDKSTESESSGAISSVPEAYCIFCASPSPASYTVVDGKIVEIKQENLEPEDAEKDPLMVQAQLRAMFIIQNILDVNLREFTKFFGEYDGHFHPSFWVSVCLDCQPIVHDYFLDVKGTQKCKVSLNFLKSVFKLMIERSYGKGGEESQDDGEEVRDTVWTAIRTNALKGFSEEKAVELLDANTDYWKDKPQLTKLMEIRRTKYRIVIKYEEPESNEEDETETRITRSRIENQDENSDESDNESDSSDKKSLPPKPKYDLVFFKCEKCSALIEGHQERINRHNKLHKPGRPQKKCETCGWVVGCVKLHSAYWHSKKAPDFSAKKVAIWPLSKWGKRNEIKLMESDLCHPNFFACPDPGYRYECRHCSGYKFWKREQAIKHSKMHDDGKGVTCPICDWLINPNKIEYHKTRYHTEKSNNTIEESLPEGKKTHSKKGKLKKGREIRKATYRSKCEECLEDFKTKWLLWSHQELVHKLDPRGGNGNGENLTSKVGLCEVCGTALRSTRGMSIHKRLHVTKN